MKIIVGSTALLMWGLNRRTPQDLDVWTDTPPPSCFQAAQGVDVHVQPERLMRLLSLYSWTSSCGETFATPDAVYTIKCSHLGWDIQWQKTKLDVLWLKAKGCKLILPLYAALREHWKDVHGNKDFLSLKQGTKAFFTDHVKYVYDHDYLHELVAYPGRPMYERCLKEGEQVLIDKACFFMMPLADQIRMFKEEITVIAFERWMVHNSNIGMQEAYRNALQKTTTNLTKGWATDFIVRHVEEFNRPDYSLFDHLLKTLRRKEMDTPKQIAQRVLTEVATEIGRDVRQLASEIADESFPTAFREQTGFAILDQDGGGEGGAESCYIVFTLKGEVIRMDYSYYSYDGYETDYAFDTARTVTPQQRTITVHE